MKANLNACQGSCNSSPTVAVIFSLFYGNQYQPSSVCHTFLVRAWTSSGCKCRLCVALGKQWVNKHVQIATRNKPNKLSALEMILSCLQLFCISSSPCLVQGKCNNHTTCLNTAIHYLNSLLYVGES